MSRNTSFRPQRDSPRYLAIGLVLSSRRPGVRTRLPLEVGHQHVDRVVAMMTINKMSYWHCIDPGGARLRGALGEAGMSLPVQAWSVQSLASRTGASLTGVTATWGPERRQWSDGVWD